MREGLAGLARGERRDRRGRASTRAVALYRGDFLSDEPYAEWAFGERDRLRDLAGQALRGLAELKTRPTTSRARRSTSRAWPSSSRWTWTSSASCSSLLLRRGRHAEAHRRHEIVRRRYKRAFGEEPPFELADLAHS